MTGCSLPVELIIVIALTRKAPSERGMKMENTLLFDFVTT